MIHARFLFRQLAAGGHQAAVFVLSVILSIVAVVAVNGFSESLNRSLLRDARSLHAADIIVRSHFPLSPPLLAAVQDIETRGRVQSTAVHEFYSVVRSGNKENSLLADLKIVGPAYPFYGEVVLSSGRPFPAVLAPGSVVVEQALLERLGLSLGDALHVGSAELVIRDVVLKEPDRPVNFLSFGPRVFISEADLAQLDLLKKGSRVRYILLLKTGEKEDLDALSAALSRAAVDGQEQVETFRTAGSRIKRFFDNFLFFLSLISVFILLLSGLGIRSSLSAYLKDKEETIAVIKALGGTGRFVTLNYLTLVALFGTAGTLIGLALGSLLQHGLFLLWGDLLPKGSETGLSGATIVQGALLGSLTVVLFAFLPIHRIRDVRPNRVFRKAAAAAKKGPVFFATLLFIILFFTGIILLQLKDLDTGLKFLGGTLALILLSALFTQGLLAPLKRMKSGPLALRQAIRGLFRAGNATRSTIITLSASLSLIFTIFLVEQNLDAAFIRSYPKNAPNLFFIDIQPDQVDPFSEAIGRTPEFYPVIRSRLLSINGEKIHREEERLRRGDNLSRAFNLTYRDHLLADERLIEGDRMFREDLEGLQVSVMDTVVEMQSMRIGDRLTFRIQGVPVTATVSSIRTRTRETIEPFFYFVFPADSLLKSAPQTIFTAIRVPSPEVPAVQNRVISRFPNISAIDVSQTISTFADILHRLSMIVRLFTLMSILAGLLIIVSAIAATRMARTQEAAYFRILGARSRFILSVFSLENALIGAASALQALLISQTAGWIIATRVLDIDYQPYLLESTLLFFGNVLLVMGVGGAATLPILRQKPVVFLREQTEE
ncbi:ABC transporter permease [Desulfococcus sp.]|uniref:ABC transporter permease n=1 Tax=Desulfococcus sp. TaxID=2025834 RepID=UPI003594789B